MPSRIELEHFLARETIPRQPRHDAELAHLHRVTTWSDDPRPLCVLAFDHRSQFEQLAARNGRPLDDIVRFKVLIADVLRDVLDAGDASVRHGAIIDHRYGEQALARLADQPIWAASPIEIPGSRPLVFDPHFGTAHALATWPSAQIVKCLALYHPDDPAGLRHEQEERLRNLYADIVALDRRMVLEVICPSITGPAHPQPLPRAIRRLYNLGIRPDWWKLEAQSASGWQAVKDVIAECDPYCKGVVILGLGADEGTLLAGLRVAAAFDICRGFAVGRSIFADAAEQWFAGSADDDAAKASIRRRYLRMIETWVKARATE